MKASELRIGNYVFTGKDNFILQFHSAFGLCNVETKQDDFNPIPLTEAWLLKFGFEKDDIDWFVLNNIKIGYDKNDEFFYLCHYRDPDYYSIKYVHQLQNLYFSLTGEEIHAR